MNPIRLTRSLLLSAALAGCGAPSPGGTLVQSNVQRASPANVPPADIAEQSGDNATFAFELYSQLSTTPGNLFFSPYSISSALAMTWVGAAGETATDMASTLDFKMPAPRVGAAFNAIDQALTSRAEAGGTDENGGPFKLSVVNALWGQKGFNFEAPFLDSLALDYGAGVRLEDFAQSPDPSRLDINAWVSANTNAKIPNLLPSGSITPDTRLVLTNAVYFNASWAVPFDPKQTADASFHALDGASVTASMMHATVESRYGQGQGWQSVELPYSNPALTLTVIVPDDGQFTTVERELSASFLDGVVAAETYKEVIVGLPKFTITTAADLTPPLTALGMGAAFGHGADFSLIDGAHDLAITSVIHQATVDIDEAGTGAAAATAVVIGKASIEIPSVTLTIDRPFLVVLRDVPTSTVIFVGRVVDPSQSNVVNPGGPIQGVGCASDNDCRFPMTACSSNCCSGLPQCATSCIQGTCQIPSNVCIAGTFNCPKQ